MIRFNKTVLLQQIIVYSGFLILIIGKCDAKKVRSCYKCLVQEGCLSLDIYGHNVTTKCIEGVEHCVISQTESKVTKAVATDYFCGGKTYDVEKPELKDGCFQSIDDPGARTVRTVCYCSFDLCNNATSKSLESILLFTLLLFVILR